ncbi:PQQ-binding-like beta-propeller repeat protein [Microbacterium sp. LWH12-1.2]|uniref:outer membrane protein assembly factor BamB family protein n=1 Tax=Microbacterium sp. LWH12-1.2 TaxID=3135259 RepID=UPI00343F57AD
MSPSQNVSRRTALQLGLSGILAAGMTAATVSPAFAAAPRPAGPKRPAGRKTTRITDIGPGMMQYSLMSGVLLDGVCYIGSRNLEPVSILALDVASGKVLHTTNLTSGHSIQALALDRERRILYAGVLQKAAGTPNLYRWDLNQPQNPAVALGELGDRDVRDLAVAPDGVLFAAGGTSGAGIAPKLWQYDPATEQITDLGVPDPSATLARAVAATDTTVYYGAGTTFGGGSGSSRATLYAYDRATRVYSDITPAEMKADPSIRELMIDGDRLLASTAGGAEPTKVAAISLADPSTYLLATSIGKTAKNFAVLGDDVFFANETRLIRWTPTSGALGLFDVGVDLGEMWGLDPLDGELLAVSGYGYVATVRGDGTVSRTIDLGEAGAPVSPQTCMGIAVGAGYAYVGGNGGVARHDLRGGGVINLRSPGEAKDAEVLGGVLYTGQYSSQGIWRYDPASGQPMQQAMEAPTAQNRPLDTRWDDVNELLLVAAQSDTEGGGSIWTFDPVTGTSTSVINPIDDIQMVRAVTTSGGIAYLGGDNAQKTGPRGTVVAWDPVAGRELWRIETGLPNGIAALESHGRYVFALTIKGGLVVIDGPRQKIVHTADHGALVKGFAALKAARGVIYGVSDSTLFRIDPKTFAVTVVVADINGGWYSGPHLNVDEEGVIYTLRGRTLVKVEDWPQS